MRVGWWKLQEATVAIPWSKEKKCWQCTMMQCAVHLEDVGNPKNVQVEFLLADTTPL